MDFNFLYLIELLGTFSFAVSGAFFAMEKKLDPFGVLIIAFVTAIGGGTLRDILIGNLPVSWLTNATTTIVIFAAAISTMVFDKFLKKFNNTLFLFDALGLGLFTIIGIERGIQLQLSMGICIALGTITASFGGVLRDVLLNNVPLIFRKEIYAMAAIFGGLMYFLLGMFDVQPEISKIICVLLIFFIRLIAVRYKLFLPRFY
ncbi:MAG TPA: trimeric intracellular cation channel family protein [Chitinophagaceae bacterium]|jgi:Predicted membrane protein